MKYWILVAIATTFTLVLSFNPLSYAWHENLGISDQQAARLSQTNPNDPEIVNWKKSMTFELDLAKGAGCFSDNPQYAGSSACKEGAKILYEACSSHPGALVACLDPHLAKLAGNSSLGLNSSNSTTP